MTDPNAHRPTPGVTVERRSFLSFAACALGVGSASGPRGVEALLGDEEDEPTSFERFVAEAVPLARELLRPEVYHEDRYLYAIASLAARVGAIPPPELRPSEQGENTWIGVSHVAEPFVVLHWRMEPGAEIRTHAHTYGNVVTLGLEGEARVRNYEVDGAPDFDSDAPFRVRLTQDQLLRPGSINVVPLAHGYCHGFVAGPDGARGVDVTTRRKEKRPTPYLELGAPAGAGAGRVLQGRWTR